MMSLQSMFSRIEKSAQHADMAVRGIEKPNQIGLWQYVMWMWIVKVYGNGQE